MSTYVFVYRTPRDFTPGDPAESDAFIAWFRGISNHVVELGEPVYSRHQAGADAGETDLGGYSLISADTLEEAVALTDGCPALARGGSVEVGELTPLPPEISAQFGIAKSSAG